MDSSLTGDPSTPSADASSGNTASPDPRVTKPPKNWVPVRALAAKAAAFASKATYTVKTKKLSKAWACVAGKMLIRELDAADPTGQQLPRPSDPAKFCAKWSAAFSQRAGVKDAPRSGRKRKLSRDVVESAAESVVQVQPRTQREMNKQATFTSIKNDHNVSFRTVWRRLREAQPRLGKHVTIEYKLPLTNAVKAERVDIATRWLRLYGSGSTTDPAQPGTSTADPAQPSTSTAVSVPPPPIPKKPDDLNTGKLNRIIWVDAKKYYVKPQAYKRWGLAGTPSVVLGDKRVNGAWVIHYYSAVNYKHGGLVLELVTGTKGKGYKPKTVYNRKVGGYEGVKWTEGGTPASAWCKAPNNTALHHTTSL